MQMDNWDSWDNDIVEENKFPIKKQSIEEKVIKEEIERTNQEDVNNLFNVKNTNNTSVNVNMNMNPKNYAKECSNKMKSNKATSQHIIVFCKTIVDENCLRITTEHLEELLEHIHKLKEYKMYKPINNTEQLKIQKQKVNHQNHKEIFGDCTEDFEEEHLRIESKYA